MTILMVFRHIGPGPHPSGTPQSVHGKKHGIQPPVNPDEKAKRFETVYLAKSGTKKVSKGMRPKKGVKPEPQEPAVDVAARLDDTQVQGAAQVIQGAEPGGPMVNAAETGTSGAKKGKEPKPPMKFGDANTTEGVANYLVQNGFAGEASLGNMETPQALVIADELGRLTSDLGVVPIDLVVGAIIVDKTKSDQSSTPAFVDFDWMTGKTRLALNTPSLNALDHQDVRYGQQLMMERSRESRRVSASVAKMAHDNPSRRNEPLAQNYIRLAEELNKDARFTRYTVDTGGNALRTMITHEFGHYVYIKARTATEGLDKELGVVYEQALDDDSIYGVSKYAYTGGMRETFAEMFTMYRGGEKDKLPNYAVKFIQKAISLAQNKETK